MGNFLRNAVKIRNAKPYFKARCFLYSPPISSDMLACQVDVRVANAAITACARGGQWQQALAIFQHLHDLGRADVAWHP